MKIGFFLSLVLMAAFSNQAGAQPMEEPPAFSRVKNNLIAMANRSGSAVPQQSRSDSGCGVTLLAESNAAVHLRTLIQWDQGRAYLKTLPDLHCPLAYRPEGRGIRLTWDSELLRTTPDADLRRMNSLQSTLSPGRIRQYCQDRLGRLLAVQITTNANGANANPWMADLNINTLTSSGTLAPPGTCNDTLALTDRARSGGQPNDGPTRRNLDQEGSLQEVDSPRGAPGS